MHIRCARCCLHNSMRAANLIMLLFGIGMIIYSLWLQKKWNQGLAELPSSSSLPRPWFIYTFIGVGIAVCLSTLCGHIIANCINNSTLCMYIVTICCILFVETAVIVAIFFRMDWGEEIAAYIDDNYREFWSFVMFHINMCRCIALLILVAQVAVIVLAVILWAVGTEPRTHCKELDVTNFSQSFLVPNSPRSNTSRQACIRCELLRGGNSRRSLLSYIKGTITERFRRRSSV